MKVFTLLFILATFKIINSSSFLGDLLHLVNHFTKHNSFFAVTGASNLYACFPPDSEKCSRVYSFQIANNNTFDFNHMTIGINLIDVLDYSNTISLKTNCTGKRVAIFMYLFENSTLTNQLETSNDCPRTRRFKKKNCKLFFKFKFKFFLYFNRFYLNDQETIIIFDKEAHLVENKKIDEFIQKRLLETLSFITYFFYDYYHEPTNSLFKKRLSQVYNNNTSIDGI